MSCRFAINYNTEIRRNGLAKYLKAVQKHNITLTKPIEATKHNQVVFQKRKGDAGDLPVTNIAHDSEWLADVPIGTPPQTLRLDLDTGSTDLWVPSTSLKASAAQKKKVTLFDPSKSETFQHIEGAKWAIEYGDGSSAKGTVGTDVVNIAGLEVQNQAVQLATEMSDEFYSYNQGLLGLGFPSNGTARPRQTPVVQNMIKQELIKEPLFTCKFVHDGPGEFTFGFIDDSWIDGDITYTRVFDKSGFWEVDSTSATINGKTFDRPHNKAIMDTGTTLLLVKDDFVEAIYAEIEGSKYDKESGGYIFPAKSKLPTIELLVGDTLFQVPAEGMVYAEVDDKGEWLYGSVQSRGDSKEDIVGDVFLKYVVAIWDVGQKRFGCAKRTDVKYDSPSGSSNGNGNGNGNGHGCE